MKSAQKKTARRLSRGGVSAAAMAGCVVSTCAMAETKASVDVSLSAVASSNPYLETGSGGVSVGGTVTVEPRLVRRNDRSSLTIAGELRRTQYTEDYGGDDAIRIGVDGTWAANSKLDLSGGASYRSSRNTIRDILRLGIPAPDAPASPPTTLLPDVSLSDRRTRNEVFSANFGAGLKLSPRDAVSLDLGTNVSRFDQPGLPDYRYSVAALGYVRVLSPRRGMIASLQFGESNYFNQDQGDGIIVRALAGIKQQLSSTMEVTAQGGVNIARTVMANGVRATRTTWAAQINFCDRGLKGTLCVDAARASQPTSLGDVSTVSTIAVRYDRRLSRRDRLSLGATAGQTDERDLFVGPRASRYYGATASFSREFNRRFSAFVSPSIAATDRAGSPFSTDIQVSAGVRYRFGAI